MRRSFDPLCGLVQNELGKRVVEGDAFIFINKRHTHQKLLIREKNGFTIFYRRLEKGTFEVLHLTWMHRVCNSTPTMYK